MKNTKNFIAKGFFLVLLGLSVMSITDQVHTPLNHSHVLNCPSYSNLNEAIKTFSDERIKMSYNFAPIADIAALEQELFNCCHEKIQHKAEMDVVNEADSEGITPVMLATIFGQEALVELLKEHGAKMDAKDRWGNSVADFKKAYERNQYSTMPIGSFYG